MQLVVKDRETLNGVVTVHSRALDVSEAPLLVATLTTHSMTGTTPELEIQLETSENLEDWASVGSSLNLTTADTTLSAFAAATIPYGRYVRAKIQLTGSDALLTVYSLWINTFPSS